MRDINFFSGYKVAKAKTTDMAIFIVLGVLVLAGAIAGVVYLVNNMFGQVEDEIAQTKAFIAAPETAAQLAEVSRTKTATEIAEQYLADLQAAGKSIEQGTIVKVSLLDFIASQTPATTKFNTMSVNGRSVAFDCLSTIGTDPMDMAHALKTSGRFTSVYLSVVTFDPVGNVSFTISCVLKGGETA